MIKKYQINQSIKLKSTGISGYISKVLEDNTYQFTSNDTMLKLSVSEDMIDPILKEIEKSDYTFLGVPQYLSGNNFNDIDFFIINNTTNNNIFEITVKAHNSSSIKKIDLPQNSFVKIATQPTSSLENGLMISCSNIQEGDRIIDDSKSFTISLKAKAFFNALNYYTKFEMPIFSKTIILANEQKIDTPPLSIQKSKKKQQFYYSKIDVKKKISFNQEIDLHIEAINNRPKEIKQNEILQIQLNHLKKHLRLAIELNEQRIFAIHGIGEGRLKEQIHNYLRQSKDIKSYKNEFHPKYGFGATEIILR